MFERLLGADGRRQRVEAILKNSMVNGDAAMAEEIVDRSEFMPVKKGETIITQGADDNDLVLIIAGSFQIIVNGKVMAARGPGDHVGEMAAIHPAQPRSATVVALEDAFIGRLPEPAFTDICNRNPQVLRRIAQELARRLLERNRHVSAYRDKIKVFIISSAESLAIARAVQNAFDHDQFLVTVWTDGVFRASHYTLKTLEEAVADSDFAIAIAHADDVTLWKAEEWPTPRDNVIFELGLFMGRLGLERAILMEPRNVKVRLPSDLAGVTTITYRWEAGSDAAALMAPACNQLRDLFNHLGPFNG
jgi:CRP/FNR family cyclic AMP-dependent transcriptional regulator